MIRKVISCLVKVQIVSFFILGAGFQIKSALAEEAGRPQPTQSMNEALDKSLKLADQIADSNRQLIEELEQFSDGADQLKIWLRRRGRHHP